MEVRPSYKPTDIGLIPESWEVKALAELGHFKNGINKAKEDFGHGFPFVNLMDVFGIPRLAASVTDLGLVNSRPAERKLYELRRGDVLFVRSSVKPAGVGLTTLIPEDLPETVFSGFLIRFRDDGVLDHDFKEHCFWSDGFRNRLIAISTVSANTNINQDALKSLKIAVPSSPSEQRAIAAALSDIDALLAGLDRLIAKKRDLKQAAMQQLLTGQTRLPGFQGEWVINRLGDTASLKARIGWQGLTTAEYLDSGDFFLVTGTEFIKGYIEWSRCHFVDEVRYKQDTNIQLRPRDVLVTKDGTIGKVALVPRLPGPATLNSGVFVIRPLSNSFHPEFFYYVLCSRQFSEFLSQLAAGSTISHLYQKDFVSFVYLAPASLEEQAAIAKVLADMDAELTTLEARRDKTRALKQGMMQELLTGRTRLV